MSDFVTLKSNGDFRRLYNRGKVVTDPALVVYYSKPRGNLSYRYNYKQKIGNAVERNRSRRVIRAAYVSVLKEVEPCYDFVFVARSKTKYMKSTCIADIMRKIMLKEGIIKIASDSDEG